MALAGPVLGHLDPQFLALLDSTNDRLRRVFATSNALTLPDQRDRIGRHGGVLRQLRAARGPRGRRGQRRLRRADVRGGVPARRRGRPGRRRVGRADRPRAAAGGPPGAGDHRRRARRDLDGGAQRHRAARGGQGRRAAAGGHGDVARGDRGRGRRLGASTSPTAGPRSAWASRPGCRPLTVSDRARDRLVERPSSWYLDLNLLSRYVQDASGGGRVYHHTAPVAMVAALHAGLGVAARRGDRGGVGAPRRVRPVAAGRARGPRPRAARRAPTTGCPSSPPSGCPPGVDEAGGPPRSSWAPTASRSAPGRASWPGRSGGSAAWATRRAAGTCFALLGALGEVLGR